MKRTLRTLAAILAGSITLALIYGHPRNFPYPRWDKQRNIDRAIRETETRVMNELLGHRQ